MTVRESGYWGICAGAIVQEVEAEFEQFQQEVYCDCPLGEEICEAGLNMVHQSVCQTVRSSAIGK